jgi:hypothetical protein
LAWCGHRLALTRTCPHINEPLACDRTSLRTRRKLHNDVDNER